MLGPHWPLPMVVSCPVPSPPYRYPCVSGSPPPGATALDASSSHCLAVPPAHCPHLFYPSFVHIILSMVFLLPSVLPAVSSLPLLLSCTSWPFTVPGFPLCVPPYICLSNIFTLKWSRNRSCALLAWRWRLCTWITDEQSGQSNWEDGTPLLLFRYSVFCCLRGINLPIPGDPKRSQSSC